LKRNTHSDMFKISCSCWRILLAPAERRCRAGSIPAPHLGGTPFKSWLRDKLCWLKVSYFLCCPYRHTSRPRSLRIVLSVITNKTKTPLPESASELYRSSDRYLSDKLVPTFADRGISRSQRSGSPTAVVSVS
jgi:hypothetical protein